MTQSQTDKLIQDGLWRDMVDCPDGADVITTNKHGIISGTYIRKDNECEAYYWRHMSWWPDQYMPIDTAPKLANALKVAVDSGELSEATMQEINRIAEGKGEWPRILTWMDTSDG